LRAVLEAWFYSLGDAVVVELEVVVGRSLRDGCHTHRLIGSAERRVDTVVGREVALAGLHKVAKVLLLVRVEIEIVRHVGCWVRVVVNHDENQNDGNQNQCPVVSWSQAVPLTRNQILDFRRGAWRLDASHGSARCCDEVQGWPGICR
jgi:hypothetical protein